MLDTYESFKIYDDRSMGEEYHFTSQDVIFRDHNVCMVTLPETIKWGLDKHILINIHGGEVLTNNFEFYYAANT